jgi:hypothetical protein
MLLAVKNADRYVAIRLLVKYGHDSQAVCRMRNIELATAIHAAVLSGAIPREEVKQFETRAVSNKPRLRFDGNQWVLVTGPPSGRRL